MWIDEEDEDEHPAPADRAGGEGGDLRLTPGGVPDRPSRPPPAGELHRGDDVEDHADEQHQPRGPERAAGAVQEPA